MWHSRKKLKSIRGKLLIHLTHTQQQLSVSLLCPYLHQELIFSFQMFQIDIVISVLCIYWDLPYIILSWNYSSTWIPLLEEKDFQFWTGFSDVPVSILIKLVNRRRCSLAPHPDIRSVEWGGLWIKDIYSIFENKLQNSLYAQIHTYILSNKLLRSDSVQSTGLNESKKRENTRELGAWWREGKVPEGSEQA